MSLPLSSFPELECRHIRSPTSDPHGLADKSREHPVEIGFHHRIVLVSTQSVLAALAVKSLPKIVERHGGPSDVRALCAEPVATAYSARNAARGSTRDARYAGSAQAMSVIIASTTGTVANVTRSWLSV